MNKKFCGIYYIKNLVNEKIYIGKSIDVISRLKGHYSILKKGEHSNLYLQRAFNKYGESFFEFGIIEVCERERLSELEIFYIEKYNSSNEKNGYNLTLGGDGTLGRIPSQEQRDRISKTNKGRKSPMEGKTHSEESRKKMSNSGMGNTATRGMFKKSYGKYVGTVLTPNGVWISRIRLGKRCLHLGCFETEEMAALAYDKKAIEIYGTETPTNFPKEEVLKKEVIYKYRKLTSLYAGVSLRAKDCRWIAICFFNGKNNYLGSYITEKEAAMAYNDFVIKNKIDRKINNLDGGVIKSGK